MNLNNLGTRIYTLIRETDVTQKKAAEAMGLDPGTLSGWIKGRHEPGATAIVIMAKHFGVSTDYLLGVSDRR